MSPADFIGSAQNPDGGWGYKQGGMSFVEPTAAALLALHASGAAFGSVSRGAAFLRGLAHADGGWGIAAIDDESGWMTAWAALALSDLDPQAAGQAGDWLLKSEALRVTNPADLESVRRVLGINASLRGWPWLPGDAAWVFPTALALFALHALGQTSHPRIAEGVAFLIDRAIASGGWNIGNPTMLNTDLPATPSSTSIALAALHALGVNGPVVSRGSDWLNGRLAQAGASSDLAWGVWALHQMGGDWQEPGKRLREMMRPDGSWNGNVLTTALALSALS